MAGGLAIPHQFAVSYLAQTDAKFFYCIARADPCSGAHWHARMQFNDREDPATGSASGCTAGYLVANSLAASGERVVLEQGIEIGRASRIYVQAESVGLQIRNVRVGGRTIPVAAGAFRPA